MRLDKCIADHSTHSRAAVKQLLRDGAVRLGDRVCRSGDTQVDPDTDEIFLAGKRLQTASARYIMLNKPAGVLSATRDGRTQTVLDLLPPELRKGLFPAGRLDIDSTGMVLLTDDGALAHRILAPKSHIPKYYLVRLAQPYDDKCAARFAAGITLSDGTLCRPARVTGLPFSENTALAELTEGKFHQVKRMFFAVENEVTGLHRIQMGGLPIDVKLGVGGWLSLLHKDIEALFKTPDFSDVAAFCVAHFCSHWINY